MKLTVFTPTYNRAYTLHKCYESLLRQTNKSFVWLIIDDGSTDGTGELVSGWIEKGGLHIEYHYQENQGMHGAHNTAYRLIRTELNVCIDSDDYMADDAVDKILTLWESRGGKRYAGIVGLDADPAGDVIGTPIPPHIEAATLAELYGVHGVKGDKKLVYRTDLMQALPPYPLFPGEKYGPLSYKYMLVDKRYPLLALNEVLCIVEYMPDGSSLNMLRQYKRNPRGFAFFRKEAMKHAPTYKERFREAVHYVSSSLMLRNIRYVNESPCKLTTLAATPLGFLLFCYVEIMQRRRSIRGRLTAQ